MPTLVLSPRYYDGSITLRRAAIDLGWDVMRPANWRCPEDFEPEEPVLHVEPLFNTAVAEQLGLALIEPPDNFLVRLPREYVGRNVRLLTAETRTLPGLVFLKPPNRKTFPAKVYASGAELPEMPEDDPELASEPVEWVAEVRFFIRDRRVRAWSPYWLHGALARKDGEWIVDHDRRRVEPRSEENIPMSSAHVRRLDPSECVALIGALGDTPETVIAVHQLRHGLCEGYVEAGPGRHDAVILRPSRPSDELAGFGQDVESLGLVLRGLEGWSCVCVEDGIARRLGPILEADLERPIRYLMDVYHTMERPVVAGPHPSARYLTGQDLDLLTSASPDIREVCLGFGVVERLLDAGIVAGAVVDGELVAVASTWAVSEKYADLSVATAGPWRGRGLATACAGLVAAVIQRSGRMPVWSTGEDNRASLRVARKLGFEEAGRRTYVIVGGDDPR